MYFILFWIFCAFWSSGSEVTYCQLQKAHISDGRLYFLAELYKIWFLLKWRKFSIPIEAVLHTTAYTQALLMADHNIWRKMVSTTIDIAAMAAKCVNVTALQIEFHFYPMDTFWSTIKLLLDFLKTIHQLDNYRVAINSSKKVTLLCLRSKWNDTKSIPRKKTENMNEVRRIGGW